MSERLEASHVLKAHALGDSMGIWGWVHATRALEQFVPEGGPVHDLWAVMARHDADTNRNDWIGLVDDMLREQEATARAEGAAEAYERAAKELLAMSQRAQEAADGRGCRDGGVRERAASVAHAGAAAAIRALAEGGER